MRRGHRALRATGSRPSPQPCGESWLCAPRYLGGDSHLEPSLAEKGPYTQASRPRVKGKDTGMTRPQCSREKTPELQDQRAMGLRAQGSATFSKRKGGSPGATTAQQPPTSPPGHHAAGPCRGGPSPLPHHAHLSPHHTPPPCPPAVRTGPAGREETRRSYGAAAGPQE